MLFSKSAKSNKPGKLSFSNCSIVSCIRGIFSPIYQPLIKSVCEQSINLGRYFLILFAIVFVTIL